MVKSQSIGDWLFLLFAAMNATRKWASRSLPGGVHEPLIPLELWNSIHNTIDRINHDSFNLLTRLATSKSYDYSLLLKHVYWIQATAYQVKIGGIPSWSPFQFPLKSDYGSPHSSSTHICWLRTPQPAEFPLITKKGLPKSGGLREILPLVVIPRRQIPPLANSS
ncbi:hypothetical protein AMQ83_23335 [Paenibacillus riograndensis]|nr:hypothetical protein AMQ83_23335 [Paenibacillus riograndensis]